MKTRHAALLTTGLVALIGCSSYIKQPTVCIDRWYGYVQEGGCPSAVKAASVDETAARMAALERERQRLANELDAARRQNGTLSSRVSDLERQLADRERELAALRSGSGDRDRLASQLTSAQSDRDRLAAELAAANQRIAALERQLAEARAAQAAPAPKLESARQGLVRALRPQIAKGDISIDLNSERLLINLASNYLFGSGQDQLKPGGVEALKKVGEVLKDYPEYSVSVAGHTDNRPIRSTLKKKFASNQELSEARAASAAKALTEGGLTSVMTVGHADTQPVASNDTEAGRAQNRRVEIIVK